MKIGRQKSMMVAIIAATMTCYSCSNGTTIHVNDGDLQGAINEAQELLKSDQGAGEKITILLESGMYSFDKTITLDSQIKGGEDTPIEIKVKGNKKATFDGGEKLDMQSASIVTDPTTLSKFGEGCEGNLYSVKIDNTKLADLLEKSNTRMSINGQMMSLSRYPNVGFGHIEEVFNEGAVYTPGRTLGDPPVYSKENPIGGEFTLIDKDVSKWGEELKVANKAILTGYLKFDWHRASQSIASVNEQGVIKLLESSRYGVVSENPKMPRRLFVTNLMCELDYPGEFYFEQATSTLFFWPYTKVENDDVLSVWAGKPFLKIDGAENIKIENLIIEGVSSGVAVVDIKNSKNVELAGCTIRNSSTLAVSITGSENCGIRSCDIYDVPGHVSLNGGDIKNLIPSHNYAINCHFTQTQYNYYGSIKVNGVGQIFQNNLIHNAIGQIMTFGGNEHLIEKNEFFNIGIEEGDGGTIYGGAQMWSWGNVVRNNFLHHLMCMPQAHPRGGIYPDDKDQGDVINENIFYKAAHRAILINGGGGQTVNGNIFLNGYIGIYNTDRWVQEAYDAIPKYDAGILKRGDKLDYIWRTEQAIGKEGWNTEAWVKKYPLFAKIMNKEDLRCLWPYECTANDNCFYGNFENTSFSTKNEKNKVVSLPFEQVPQYFTTSGNRDIEIDIFTDPNTLDFSYKNSTVAQGMPEINFEQISLYKDKYRTTIPDKSSYRRKLKEHFEGRDSYNPDAVYDPATINNTLYFNTGLIVLGL